MTTFPNDIPDSEWDPDNLQMWSEPRVANSNGLSLTPLQAKALHVIGTIVQILNAAGHLLYAGKDTRPYADYCLYAYMIACTAIELLGRCQTGEQSLTRTTLEEGLKIAGLDTVTVNVRRDDVMTGYII